MTHNKVEALCDELRSYGLDISEEDINNSNKRYSKLEIHTFNNFIDEIVCYDVGYRDDLGYFRSDFNECLSEESRKYVRDFDTFVLVNCMQYGTIIIPHSVEGVIVDIAKTGMLLEDLVNYKPNYEGIKTL